ncbi:MAG: protein-glutamate O-methyltransferase family protein, partial [Chloroflexi bacterium]|nr:protein-glutamate O-methyltransferase family protein [Chloroflexota bacterium]
SDLILLKGDVNYRRLLEDRDWPPTTDLAEVTRYMPAPFVTLRTLKAELVVGLAPGLAESLAAEDPDWLVNGERGVIHYVPIG